MVEIPYFMNNQEWFFYDYEKKKYILTSKASEKAKKSYEEFYKDVENDY